MTCLTGIFSKPEKWAAKDGCGDLICCDKLGIFCGACHYWSTSVPECHHHPETPPVVSISAPSPPESSAVICQGILCRTCGVGQEVSLDMLRRLAAAVGTCTDSGWKQQGKKPYETPSGPVSALYSQFWHLSGDLCSSPPVFIRCL